MPKYPLLTFLAIAVGLVASSVGANAIQLDRNLSFSHNDLVQVSANTKGAAAQKFIDNMGKRAISFLSNEALSQAQKEREFRKLLRSSFDLSTIGRFALGRNWKVATAKEKKEYQRLFENMVVEVYAARFNDYQGQEFNVSGFRDNGKKDVLVTSYIVPDTGSKVQVDWRVRNKNGKHKIIDVIIEGVSMSLTQRSDFSSVIQRGGGNIEVLLAHLRQ